MILESFDPARLLVSALLVLADLFLIAGQGFFQSCVLGFLPGDESPPVHFSFEQSSPSFGFGPSIKRLCLDRGALPTDLDLPLIWTAFKKSRHNIPPEI